MSSLAASLLSLSLLGGWQGEIHGSVFLQPAEFVQSARQTPRPSDPAYQSLRPDVVTLYSHDQPIGIAALIDTGGLYVAPKNSIGTDSEIEGKFPNGQIGHLRRLNTDAMTGLALLKSDYVPPFAKPISLVTTDPEPGAQLVVAMETGAVRGRIESNDKVGMSKANGRLVPLSEIRFETPTSPLSGALVFTTHGSLVGAINATLAKAKTVDSAGTTLNQDQVVPTGAAGGFGGGGAARGLSQFRNVYGGADSLGPANMTIAYTPGIDVLKRVVEGFLTPSHVVAYASLGAFCTDGPGGALITEVVSDSPADKLGLRPGDMIISLGTFIVRGGIDFAKLMNKAQPGEQTIIRWVRAGHTRLATVTFGRVVD